MRRFRLSLLFLILIIAFWFYHPFVLSWLGHGLIQQDPPFKADVIVVLAGDVKGERIGWAVELAKQQWAPRILVSSAGRVFDSSEGELAIQFATKRGAPRELFDLIQHNADSTEEESEVLVAACRKLAAKKVLLVTSDYHTARAGKIFRRIATDIEVHTSGSATYNFNPDSWWTLRPSRKVWLMEAVKTVAVWLRM